MTAKLNLQGIGMTSRRTRTRLVQRLRDHGIANELVLDAINETPRHAFIDEALAHRAYEDIALPIGFNQTISQPYIVARMTEALLADGAITKVLEVGTGSGYQTAILSSLATKVYTVERISPLLTRAEAKLDAIGYRNICFKHADGVMGWPEEGPFDAIMVTAAPRVIPEALVQQLLPEGRLIVPVGNSRQQVLVLLKNTAKGIKRTQLDAVMFVPLLGGKT